jgi:hypothetical protein
VRRQRGDIAALEHDRSLGRPEKPADQVEEGGLAGAVRADDGTQLALAHRQRNVTYRDQAAEALSDVLDFEEVHDDA